MLKLSKFDDFCALMTLSRKVFSNNYFGGRFQEKFYLKQILNIVCGFENSKKQEIYKKELFTGKT